MSKHQAKAHIHKQVKNYQRQKIYKAAENKSKVRDCLPEEQRRYFERFQVYEQAKPHQLCKNNTHESKNAEGQRKLPKPGYKPTM